MPAATRGPVPKRSTERRRRNKDSQVDVVQLPAGSPPVLGAPKPPASDDWHPIARDLYESLAESGQAQFFEPSDWQAARVCAHALTVLLNQGKFSSMLFAAVWAAMGDLGATEASRRRIRMEIDRGEQPGKPAGVAMLADYRKALGAAGSKPKKY